MRNQSKLDVTLTNILKDLDNNYKEVRRDCKRLKENIPTKQLHIRHLEGKVEIIGRLLMELNEDGDMSAHIDKFYEIKSKCHKYLY